VSESRRRRGHRTLVCTPDHSHSTSLALLIASHSLSVVLSGLWFAVRVSRRLLLKVGTYAARWIAGVLGSIAATRMPIEAMAAPMNTASWKPAAIAVPIGVLFPELDAPMLMTVTKTAVPTAPPSCWIVPIMALPWAKSRAGRDPRADVESGVKINEMPRLSVICEQRMSHVGPVGPSVVIHQSAPATATAPGTARGRASNLEERPGRRREGAHQQPSR
jgi:hypothetical protein